MNHEAYEFTINVRTLEEILQADHKLEWVVKGILSKRGKAALIADAGVGKSFLLLQLGWAISSGTSFLGQFEVVEPHNVLLLDTELGVGAIDERIKGMNCFAPNPTKQFYIWDGNGVKLTDDRQRRQLIEYLREKDIGVLLLDSIVYLHNYDENAVEMKNFYLNLDEIARKSGCAMFVTHHTSQADPKGKKGGRGHTSFKGWLDIQLSLEKTDDPRILTYQKARFLRKPKEAIYLNLNEGWFEVRSDASNVRPELTLHKLHKIKDQLRAITEPLTKTALFEGYIKGKDIVGDSRWHSLYFPWLIRDGFLMEVSGKYIVTPLPEASEKPLGRAS